MSCQQQPVNLRKNIKEIWKILETKKYRIKSKTFINGPKYLSDLKNSEHCKFSISTKIWLRREIINSLNHIDKKNTQNADYFSLCKQQ